MKKNLKVTLVLTVVSLLMATSLHAADMTDGEVRKIDMEQGKVTLRHAEIKNLDMPSMTMVFVVKDKSLISDLKVGDKVRFKAVNEATQLTVTEIQRVVR